MGCDLGAHLGRRRGGEGEHRHPGQRGAQRAQPAVRGAEVVPPRADAVRLVDGEHADTQLRELGQQAVRSLGADEDEGVLAWARARAGIRVRVRVRLRVRVRVRVRVRLRGRVRVGVGV